MYYGNKNHVGDTRDESRSLNRVIDERRYVSGNGMVISHRVTASHITRAIYVGIKGRKKPVRAFVVHPPRIGERIRWMTFNTKTCDFRLSYYEVVQVQWDVRDLYQYMYRPGDEAEDYLTIFLKPVKNSPGELDRANRGRARRPLTARGIAAL
jgi:hypothetical protein